LFIPEQPYLPVTPSNKKTAPKPKNRLNAKELREAVSAGIDAAHTKGKQSKRRAPATNDDEHPRKRRERKSSAATPGPKRGKKPVMTNLHSLGRTNIVADAQANASRPGIPTFTSRDKTNALNELIASIPSADRGSHNSDKSALLTATRKFKGHASVKSDGQGGWKLRGMESSLYHHQLLGAAFLRERENSNTMPKGGLVCDEMGFGKTIQMM
jgi:SNF2 family DNA or RNA helicase